ncbi:flagellar protein FlgN [Planococcus salinus]|uniref:Flagellar protein FlgN n=1 Tax=Planococcus salinus TaxID=1848460 RepID=A0A3M8P540_9BACL|nr:flagellar protein FlgN [Planococcus salinus]RNF38765.1 flagellar protein FlgN [Planococcus salinus]
MPDLLVTTMEKLISLHKRLIDCADQKKTILIERRVDELNRLVPEEAELIRQLESLDSERQQLMADLSEKQTASSFGEFIEQLPDGAAKDKLQSQLASLQQLMAELQEKNRTNEQLLKDSMRFVHHMIEQVTKSKQQNFNYQSPNSQQKSPTNNRGFFDTKA